MSKKKQLNLIEFAVQALVLLSFLVFQTVNMYSGSYSYTSDSISHTSNTLTTSVFGYLLFNAPVFLVLVGAAMFANGIVCLVSVLGNSTDRDGKAHVTLAVLAALFGFWCMIADFTSSGVTLEISPAFKIFTLICSIAIVSLAVIKRSSRVVPVKEAPAATIIQATSDADELKKYKDLLDIGVITQEEFDAKKKQLLGL